MDCKDVGIRKSGFSQEVRLFQVSSPFLSSSIIGDTPLPYVLIVIFFKKILKNFKLPLFRVKRMSRKNKETYLLKLVFKLYTRMVVQ